MLCWNNGLTGNKEQAVILKQIYLYPDLVEFHRARRISSPSAIKRATFAIISNGNWHH